MYGATRISNMVEFSLQRIEKIESLIGANPYQSVCTPKDTMHLIARYALRISVIMPIIIGCMALHINDRKAIIHMPHIDYSVTCIESCPHLIGHQSTYGFLIEMVETLSFSVEIFESRPISCEPKVLIFGQR